jgi:hypothetical protein
MDLSLFFARLLSVARLMYSLSNVQRLGPTPANVFALRRWVNGGFAYQTPEILAAKPGPSVKRAKAKPTASSRCGSGALASACPHAPSVGAMVCSAHRLPKTGNT